MMQIGYEHSFANKGRRLLSRQNLIAKSPSPSIERPIESEILLNASLDNSGNRSDASHHTMKNSLKLHGFYQNRLCQNMVRVLSVRYLERNLVVEIKVLFRTFLRRCLTRNPSRTIAAAAATVEHDQGTTKSLQHNLGRITVIAVPIRPFPGLELAFEVNL